MSRYASSNENVQHAADLVDKVARARDDMGIVKNDAFHNQLSQLTPADWRVLSTAFPKNENNPDGFYITDDNNQVSIHNDMRKADKTAHEGLLKGAWDLTTESFAVPGAFIAGGTLGALNGGIIGGSAALVLPDTISMAVGDAALVAAGTIGGPAIVAAGTAAYLYYESRHEKNVAQKDLIAPQTLSMQIK